MRVARSREHRLAEALRLTAVAQPHLDAAGCSRPSTRRSSHGEGTVGGPDHDSSAVLERDETVVPSAPAVGLTTAQRQPTLRAVATSMGDRVARTLVLPLETTLSGHVVSMTAPFGDVKRAAAV